MRPNRMPYWSLPFAVRDHIEQHIGTVTTASSVRAGENSSVADLVGTRQGRYFVKALPADHRWVWTQQREADIAPHLGPLAPALVARVVHDGWDVVVMQAVDGTPANYRPGSPDLPAVAELLTRLGEVPCPDIELRDAASRLREYAEDADLHHFSGAALLHTDLNPDNIIIGNGQAHLVDWGWATRGAAWLDPAYWVIWLVAAGHQPAAAEKLAATVPAWHHAAAGGIDAFASANARLWTAICGDRSDSFTEPVADAARRWHLYRLDSHL